MSKLQTLTYNHETRLAAEGFRLVAGLDEAGMGPWAGPVVAGAVILPLGCELPLINDSKKLTEKRRDEAAAAIKELAVAWAVGEVPPDEVDRINPRAASSVAMQRAIEALGVQPDFLLVDAFGVRGCPIPQRGIIRGDAEVISIAAASILAKTHRDAAMVEFSRQYPGYGFEKHKGYGTAVHSKALGELGPCPIHRLSYAPVRKALQQKEKSPV